MPEPAPGSAQSLSDIANAYQHETFQESGTYNLAAVLALEAEELKHSLPGKSGKPDSFGVCFSGGGIRSACVALGVSQSLARHGLLQKVQYISAISGGGYWLGALTAWIKRTEDGFRGVARALARSADPAEPLVSDEQKREDHDYPRFLEPDVIRNLRRYSSYLTPRLGLLSGDSLTLASIYLRNLLLNLSMMVSAVFALMLLAQLMAPQRFWQNHTFYQVPFRLLVLIFLYACVAGCFLQAVRLVEKEIETIRNNTSTGSSVKTRNALCFGFIGCMLLWIATPSFFVKLHHANLIAFTFAALLAVVGFLLTWYGFHDLRPSKESDANAESTHEVDTAKSKKVKSVHPVTKRVLGLAWLAAAGLVAGIANFFFSHMVSPGIVFVGGGYVIFGLSAILASFPLVSYLFIGVLGNQLPDAEREWLARFAGYFLAAAACATIVMAVAIDGPAWMDWIICSFGKWGWKGFSAAVLPGGWIFVTLSGVLLGRSSATGKKKPSYSATNLLVAIAPPVFILGVLMQVSWASNVLLVHTVGVTSLVAAPNTAQGTPHDSSASKTPAAQPAIQSCCQPCPQQSSKDAGQITDKLCPFERQVPKIYDTRIVPTLFERYNKLRLHVRLLPDLTKVHNFFLRSSTGSPLFVPRDHPLLCVLGLFSAFAGFAIILAWRLDINEFSMHLFYRNRLVRAFPGASNLRRKPNVFTNFDFRDDIPLCYLLYNPPFRNEADILLHQSLPNHYDGPYPLWGTALNITHGEDLSWQQRKAASFIYSPLFCGWDYVPEAGPFEIPVLDDLVSREQPQRRSNETQPAPFGYRPTTTYSGEGGNTVLGTAMAASGAAASPNMGYHTRAGVAALLALFNVRLGWWTGNPRDKDTWNEYAPGAYYLLNELLGSTGSKSPYVYLSDGGHFENLGLYELVRRRIRLIIVSDADADGTYSFSDLGNAIERCRRDFGVHIDLPAAQHMAPVLKDNLSEQDQRLYRHHHYCLGTIQYPQAPWEAKEDIALGYILYIKSSLTGDEPPDVLAMRSDYPDFPHDSTGNQFFNEGLFESYRALGQHMTDTALEDLRVNKNDNLLSGLPKKVGDAFYELLNGAPRRYDAGDAL
jgi:hypothetical protein